MVDPEQNAVKCLKTRDTWNYFYNSRQSFSYYTAHPQILSFIDVRPMMRRSMTLSVAVALLWNLGNEASHDVSYFRNLVNTFFCFLFQPPFVHAQEGKTDSYYVKLSILSFCSLGFNTWLLWWLYSLNYFMPLLLFTVLKISMLS